MANAGGIRAGRAFVELFADDSALVAGLERARHRIRVFGAGIRQMGTALTIMGGAMLAPLTIAAKAFATLGGASADGVRNAWKQLEDGGRRLSVIIGSALGPSIISLTKELLGLMDQAAKWVQANPGLVVTFAKIAGAAVIVGGGLIVLSQVFTALSVVIGAVSAVVTFFGGALSALMGPVGLVLLGLGALAVGFVTLTDTGAGAMETLQADTGIAIDAMADALAAGNLTLAAQSAWKFIKLEWARGSEVIGNIWMATIVGMAKAWYTISDGIVDRFKAIQQAMAMAQGFVERKQQGVAGWIAENLLGITDTSITRDDSPTPGEHKERQLSAERWNDKLDHQAKMNAATQELLDARSAAAESTAAAKADLDKTRIDAALARASTNAMPGLPGADMADVNKKLDVLGTFSGFGLGQVGMGTSAADKQVDLLKRIDRNTEKMAVNSQQQFI